MALLDGAIVGFAHVWEAGPDEVRLRARTHPDATGRGIGSALLEFCETRAWELTGRPGRKLTTTSWAADDRAPALLEGRGYAPVRYFVQMKIAADEVPPPGPWPPGVEVELFSEGTIADDALHDAWREAFAGHWGQSTEDEATFWQVRRDPEREVFPFDPSLWLVATRDGEVVGFSFCEQNLDDPRRLGRVAELGVVPADRGQGLGYALLTHSFQELRERSADEVVLDVDTENVTSALRLYRKAGMTPQPSFTIWGREVAQGPQA